MSTNYTPVSRAWEKIEELSQLSALRDDDRFAEYNSNFLVHLDAASVTLRRLLPVDEIVPGAGTQSSGS